jgi:hypothetical protein
VEPQAIPHNGDRDEWLSVIPSSPYWFEPQHVTPPVLNRAQSWV